jgi:chemotaxis protein CheD
MVENGSDITDIEAQIYGGAYNSEISPWNIGSENIYMAKKILGMKGIPIVSEDVGGDKGKKIIFNTETNKITVLRADDIRMDDCFPYEYDR